MKFSELNFDPALSAAIEKLQFDECTPIQEQSIPHILQGRDVAGLAQTGTGKTGAFLLPLMERILRSRPLPDDASEEQKLFAENRAFKDWRAQNFILVLVPTRELADQVYENVQKFSVVSGLRGCAIYGGTGYDKQREALKAGVEFVVATPGRLIDLFKENLVDLKQVRAIVFDEADRMFDMGFKDDMKYILQRVPKERQFLVYSATLNFDVLNTAYEFGADPVEVNISRDQTRADNVKDSIFHVGTDEKPQHLLSILRVHNPRQAIIFTNFKMNVEKITKFLNDNGVPAMAISSLLSQSQRTSVIEKFKADNHLNILVATDVAARGLDIKGVDMVVNYELPMDSESYVHRIGRTGRAGTEGKAFSLVSDKDVDSLMRIEEYLKHKLEVSYMENDQLVTDFKPFQRFDDGGRKRFDRGEGRSGGGGDRREKRGGNDRGPRREGGSKPGQQQPQGQGSGGGPRQDRGPRPPRPQQAGAKGGPQQHGQQKPRPMPSGKKHKIIPPKKAGAAKPSIGKSVVSFLKGLFGKK